MITPRRTRLVRVNTLHSFRNAVVRLACTGMPADARHRLVVVPTRAAAAHLVRAIETTHLHSGGAMLLPEFVTRGELIGVLSQRLRPHDAVLSDAEREVLLGVAARTAQADGNEPPFALRPGLLAEMLRFYDELRRHRNTIDEFERRALDRLEPGAEYDRGAARLVRQTRFLVATFHDLERRVREAGADEHLLRDRLLAETAATPWRHVIITVADRGFDPHGLYPADWDLLARIPGLASLDIVITDTVLAGALHERMHTVLPGLEEVRDEEAVDSTPQLLVAGQSIVHAARDREEEVALFARRVKHDARVHGAAPDRRALVVQQPLPYVYVARDVLRAAGIPCQMFDALPLAAEPFSAALDLAFSAVSSNFGRQPVVALLRSPHFQFAADGERGVAARDLIALDRALAEAGYLGGLDSLDRLIDEWSAKEAERGLFKRALRAAMIMRGVVGELTPLRDAAPVAAHAGLLLAFLRAHEQVPGPDDPLRARQLRARGAVLGALMSMQQAYARFDDIPVDFDHVAALTRRWIEAQTFQPLTGDDGVHVVDAASARFGDFDEVQLAGLVDDEWPERPRRNIFYSPGVLRDLGWPADSCRIDGARAAFIDLLKLPAQRLVLSTFNLEADAIVSPSLLVEEVERAGLPIVNIDLPFQRIFDDERLVFEIGPAITPAGPSGVEGTAQAPAPGSGALPALSLSAIERYQDCPFKFFAADVLRLEEAPEDESMLSPRARGRFIHEVFQRFFEAWDRRGGGAITSVRLDGARLLFHEVAEPLLERLPEADAALERTRLFGSAISVGVVDVVLGLEASAPVDVRERWLEHRFEGEFDVGGSDGRTVALKGVADRVDLLDGRRLRVVDYKSGSAPNPRRALQVPVYALVAQEQLSARDGQPWQVDAASYVALTGKRNLVSVVKAGSPDAEAPLQDARARLFELLDGIDAGLFPPRPHDEMICRYCAYPSVCRKDYVGDE
ncbi:MAG TPA: PD-(D/E)XK nuclease family protein [Vicinamibacterales bacterium]|nr:PD-(D/E)XK nuclease family protein [Vicinamibacterales bacterium]